MMMMMMIGVGIERRVQRTDDDNDYPCVIDLCS